MNIGKQKIIDLFNKNVRGKSSNTSSSNQGHDGKDGHWLETQMGITHNRKNEPDILGFEMKNNTRSKTTFGDWSADYYIFKDLNFFQKNKGTVNRDRFMEIFGAPNIEKNNRYAWSGRPTPKINKYNDFGQKLIVDKKNNLLAIYSFTKDKRKDKKNIVPHNMQKNKLILARWDVDVMTKKVEQKFNNLGWFKCVKDRKGVYSRIVFGEPINFNNWIAGVKKGLIYFDNGMHVGNKRPYSSWRANNAYWKSLITSEY